jgi:predicted RNA-binding Zn ribbon-like protein
MTFEWTPHRFSGGALALDVANSVILRFDAKRSIDRFADGTEVDRFTVAATALCAEREDFPALSPVPADRMAGFMALREAIDAYFRTRISHKDNGKLADLLERIAESLRTTGTDGSETLETATALSALRLTHEDERKRLKICPNCEWLFLDRSKNRSRTWCDMAVCGNRMKARLHYRKAKKGDME